MSNKVIIIDHTFSDLEIEREILAAVDAEVVHSPAKNPEEVIKVANDADALLIIDTQITMAVFEQLSDLKVIGKVGIGVDSVDLDAATEHGVKVVNVPDYCIEEVSTHALSLFLAAVRKIPSMDRSVKNGAWDWQRSQPIHRLAGNTFGFVAFGKIAQGLAKKLQGFDLELVAYDPYLDETDLAEYGVSKVEFEELLETADAISIHAPLTEKTRGLFDAATFERMKDHAVLVNTSRGPIIDENALYDALTCDEIAAVGLDVMVEEPPGDSPLFDLDAVTLTPHAGWYSETAKRELRQTVAESVATALRGEEPKDLVNADVRD